VTLLYYRSFLHALGWLGILLILAFPADCGERIPVGGKPLDLERPENRVEWKAQWIQDPLFEGLPFRDLLRKQKAKDESGVSKSDPKNVHTLFRKAFRLEEKRIRSARLFITADDVYKLYINGAFIGLGPAPAYLFAYPYNGWDVTDILRAGAANCIAVHVYYQGLVNRVWGSGDNQQGLLAQLDIIYEDGSQDVIKTDGSWRYHRTEAYVGKRTVGYQTQFTEDIDLRKVKPGWKEAGFDDSGWEAPAMAVGDPTPAVYTLVPQSTPPLYVEKVFPSSVVKKEEGQYFIDFGTELTGSTCFKVSGPEGHVVEIRHGEECSGPQEVRFDMRANCRYQEFCTLSGRPEDVIEFFDYKGFRYVEVLDWPEELTADRIWVLNRHYPFPEDASTFHSSDPELNRIWALCKEGVKQGTQDTYLDCPTREKGGYLGDAYVTGQSHLYLTGDGRILRKAIQDFAYSARICPGLMAVAPGNYMQEIADYSLLWPVVLYRYAGWTGNIDFLNEMLPVLDGLLDYFARYENEHGLLEKVDEKWNLVDWPANLRDGFDYELAVQGVNTVLNQFYYGCLRAAARCYRMAGNRERFDALEEKAEGLAQAAFQHLMDAESGLFVDGKGSKHSALHANALPLMFNMKPPGGFGPLIDCIKRKRMTCGVYFASFVLEGLYNVGESEFAYELLTSRDEHSWHAMLEAGATTCMEAWGPDQKWNTSFCHPWSSCPIYIVSAELMGLITASLGWSTFLFQPRLPAGLESAEIWITTPPGKIKASFKQEGREIAYRLHVPKGSEAVAWIETIGPTARVDGEEVDCTEMRDAFDAKRWVLSHPLESGEHTIKVTRRSAK
jgi:hypothetical protein